MEPSLIRLPLILAAFVTLTAAQCDAKSITYYSALAKGEAPAAFLTIPDEPEVVALVTEPEVIVTQEPDCTPTRWRGVWTNPCTGETWDVE
jgi:hypothetical protein